MKRLIWAGIALIALYVGMHRQPPSILGNYGGSSSADPEPSGHYRRTDPSRYPRGIRPARVQFQPAVRSSSSRISPPPAGRR